jgi:hypothetical protein
VSNQIETATDEHTSFAMAIGGGLDLNVSEHVDIRLFQVEWIPVFTKDRQIVGSDGTRYALLGQRRDDWRFAVGVVFK